MYSWRAKDREDPIPSSEPSINLPVHRQRHLRDIRMPISPSDEVRRSSPVDSIITCAPSRTKPFHLYFALAQPESLTSTFHIFREVCGTSDGGEEARRRPGKY